MSWSLSKTGRAGKLSALIKQAFVDNQGCPKGSAEEAAKNALGEVAETLCKSLPADKVVTVVASGSAWNNADGSAQSHTAKFELQSVGDFVE